MTRSPTNSTASDDCQKAPTPMQAVPHGALSTLLIHIDERLYTVRRLHDGRHGWQLKVFPDDGRSRDVWLDEHGELHCDCASASLRPERATCRHRMAILEQELLP